MRESSEFPHYKQKLINFERSERVGWVLIMLNDSSHGVEMENTAQSVRTSEV